MSLYSAIDLHSNNNVVVVIDEQDRVLYEKRLPNTIEAVESALSRFKSELKGVAVESTFNWYWLADGLIDRGYNCQLVNTTAATQYSGLKRTDDQYDAYWLAHLMRLDILPTGYIYPKETRGVRDLLRKRLQFVRFQTANILSLQNQYWRNTGIRIKGDGFKSMRFDYDRIEDDNVRYAMDSNLILLRTIRQQIKAVEKQVLSQVKLRPDYQHLLTVDGIGQALALTIMLETGDISRFQRVGNYASYCRCVDSEKTSNGKKKGKGNVKNGNKYLAWAYVEAANFARRHNAKANAFYQRKAAKTKRVIATKSLAHKLARACYYILRDQVPFDQDKLFA